MIAIVIVFVLFCSNVDTPCNILQWTWLRGDCAAGLQPGSLKNILLDECDQNKEWFQVSVVTLVHYDIVREYNVQKMSCNSLSMDAFASQLATKWGVSQRGEQAVPPPLFRIPEFCKIRNTLQRGHGNRGQRNVLNVRRLSQAIIKCSIVQIINEHFENRTRPKCVTLLQNSFLPMICVINDHWLPKILAIIWCALTLDCSRNIHVLLSLFYI